MSLWRTPFILLAVFALSLSHAHAQALGATPLSVLISPQYPAPYQTITITPNSTLYDLNASTVTISVNGTVIQRGSGSAPATYTVGGPGSSATISVTATTADGPITATAHVSPASVALIEEPVSSTHPFYLGGALVAPQGRVKFTVIPDLRTSSGGTPVSPANLVYTWKSGDQILQDSSGIGRATLIVSAPVRYRDAVISVTVSSQDGSLAGQASLTLAPANTGVIIYKDGPLLGPLFDAALGTDYTMTGSEDTFRAVPYYFAGSPSLSWSVGGVLSGSDPVVTVRTTGASAGSAVLSATAQAPGSYESATGAVTVHFGGSGDSTNIFGL